MAATTKSLKTPLRYPGGKSRAVVKLFQFIPDLGNYKEFREPFLGGGSVAIAITKRYPDLSIWVNDLYTPLFDFWTQLQHNGDELTKEIRRLKEENSEPETARGLFNESKDYLGEDYRRSSPFSRAVSFFIVNKCSFSGLTESSSFSPQASQSNFSLKGIDRLPEYSELIQHWRITNLSYEEMLWDKKDVFIYLDPPYDIKDNLYGRKGGLHKKFDHDVFAQVCDGYCSPMLISYNSDQIVKDRFKEWTVAEFAHTYTMRSVGCYNTDQASRKELVLTNYEV